MLDDLGFNAFDLSVKGLGTGSFYSRQEGVFGGFRQGTPEYDHLLSMHLGQVQEHLAANGWLGKEYIYWFDEPDPKDYPFVREGMLNIRKNASKLTRFITEHRPGPDIMDVSEIGCTIFHRVDPGRGRQAGPAGARVLVLPLHRAEGAVGDALHRSPGRQPADLAVDVLQVRPQGDPRLAGQLLVEPDPFPGRRPPESLGRSDVLHRGLRRPVRPGQLLGERRRPVPLSAQPEPGPGQDQVL